MPRFFPIYFVLFDGNFTVENGSQHSVGGLSNIPKFKKALVCLREKICVLDKLCSGMICNNNVLYKQIYNNEYMIITYILLYIHNNKYNMVMYSLVDEIILPDSCRNPSCNFPTSK